MKTLPPLLLLVHLVACLPGTAATVLTNLGSSELSVRGPAAAGRQIRYGYEFTVDGGDYELDSVTFAMAAPPVFPASGPVKVSIWKSPAGPDTAVQIATLSGPGFPGAGDIDWQPAAPIVLNDGATYFLRLEVDTGKTVYLMNCTKDPFTGPWDFAAGWTKPGSNSHWLPDTSLPIAAINATLIPVPAAGIFGGLGFLMLFRRRSYFC